MAASSRPMVDPCANVSLAPAPTPRPGLAFPNAMGSPDRAAGPPHSQAHAQVTPGTSCLRASPVVPEHPGAGAMSSLGNLLPANSAHALQLRPRAQGIHPKPREIPQSDMDDLILSCLNVGLPCAETELSRVKIIRPGPWSIGHSQRPTSPSDSAPSTPAPTHPYHSHKASHTSQNDNTRVKCEPILKYWGPCVYDMPRPNAFL